MTSQVLPRDLQSSDMFPDQEKDFETAWSGWQAFYMQEDILPQQQLSILSVLF